MKIIVRGFRVLCEPIERKYGDLLVPNSQINSAKPDKILPWMRVVGVGEPHITPNGDVVPIPCKEGDTVMLEAASLTGAPLILGTADFGKQMLVVPAQAVALVLENPEERMPAPAIQTPMQMRATPKRVRGELVDA